MVNKLDTALSQSELEVSQPVAEGYIVNAGGSSEHLTVNWIAKPVEGFLYSSPPDYEALKDENVELYRTQLKLTGIIKYIVGMTEFAGKEKATRDTDIKKHVLNFVKGLEAENEALKAENKELKKDIDCCTSANICFKRIKTNLQAENEALRKQVTELKKTQLTRMLREPDEVNDYVDGYFADLGDVYCDIEKDKEGKWSVFFRERSTNQEAWGDQIDVEALSKQLSQSQQSATVEAKIADEFRAECDVMRQRVAELANKGRSRNLNISDYSDVEYVQAYFEAHFEDFDELVTDHSRLQRECNRLQESLSSLIAICKEEGVTSYIRQCIDDFEEQAK